MTIFRRAFRPPAAPGDSAEAAFLATIVEDLPDPVAAIGADDLVWSNRSARSLDGLGPDPLPRAAWARRHRAFARGADRPLTAAEIPLLRALQGEDVASEELEVRARAGPPEVFVASAHPLRRGRRAVVGAFSVLHARSAADATPAFPYEDVLGRTADGIAVICAVTGSFIYTNDAWDHALGYAAGELAGRHISDVTAPSVREPQEVAAEMLEVLNRRGVWRGELELRRRDGTTVWWEETVSRYDDELGRPAWIVVGRDVGARREEAQVLRGAEQRLRLAFDALPVAAALADDTGRLLTVNDSLVALAGVEREELLGRSVDEVLEPVDADRARSLRERARRGELSRYRVRARRRSPRPVTVDVTTTVVRHVDGQPLPAVIVVEPRT